MGQVTIRVNGRTYNVACDDGQEARLIQLSKVIDQKAKIVAQSVGSVGDGFLLLMTSLLIADELDETRTEVSRLERLVARAGTADGADPDFVEERARAEIEGRVADVIDEAVRKVEDIAGRLTST